MARPKGSDLILQGFLTFGKVFGRGRAAHTAAYGGAAKFDSTQGHRRSALRLKLEHRPQAVKSEGDELQGVVCSCLRLILGLGSFSVDRQNSRQIRLLTTSLFYPAHAYTRPLAKSSVVAIPLKSRVATPSRL